MEEFDEADAWQRARGGDADAFASLFDVHHARVFGHALRLTRSAHDAEDVTAMVFLEAWRRRGSVRVVNGSIVGWLLVTANNVSHNLTRNARRYRTFIDGLSPSDEGRDEFADADVRLDDAWRDARVRESFSKLSQNDQNVITLCVIEELTLADASRTLGVPVGTVKSRLSRAKQRLSALTTEALAEKTLSPGGAA